MQTLQASHADLTKELQTIKAQLAQAKQASPTATEPAQEVQRLQVTNAQLTTELQEIKTQLAQALQAPQAKAEPTQEMQTLQASHADLTKELQKMKAQLTGQLLETQHKLDRFHPELQSLQNELRNGELQNQILDMELLKKNKEINDQEDRLSAYTSLPSSSSPVEESIV